MPPATPLESLRDRDLYKLFDVPEDSTKEVITKAYRKKALSCHPDKNPDNPKAAEMFHLLTQTLQVLTDVAARGAYDRCRKAKKVQEERNSHLDAKRRKLKEDLEAREKNSSKFASTGYAFSSTSSTTKPVPDNPMSQFEREVMRLRKEGSRLVEEEQERLRQELQEQLRSQRVVQLDTSSSHSTAKETIQTPRLKIRWKVEKDDDENGGVTQESLSTIFSQYGPLTFVIMSKKKPGSAIIEFASTAIANAAFWGEQNRNLFEMEWIITSPSTESTNLKKDPLPIPRPPPKPSSSTTTTLSHDDFERNVLERIRLKAAKRKQEMDLSA